MPFLTRSRRAVVPAATLFLAVANAQTCYYPDGKTTSTDIPCDPGAPASACCGSDSFCLADGLCYGGGMVLRGSCTDKSWKSDACAAYCTSEDKNAEIAIIPCTANSGGSNTFTCGMNSTNCQSDTNTFTLSADTSLVLRPAQIAALVGSSLQTTSSGSTATVTTIPDGYFSGAAMAGLAIGIALPLLILAGVLYMLLRKERRKFGHGPKQKLMYKLPDDIANADELPQNSREGSAFSFARSAERERSNNSTPSQAPMRPPISLTAAFQSNRSSHVSSVTSPTDRRASARTFQTMSSRPVLSRDFPPSHSQTFLERYETMKRAAAVQSQEVIPGTPGTPGTTRSVPGTPQPQELDSKEKGEKVRYELSDTRMST